MSEVTVVQAAHLLEMSPLEVMVRAALRGIPCPRGLLDSDLLPVIGSVTARPGVEEPLPIGAETDEAAESERERRLRIIRRILDKLTVMGKYWPARTEKRSTARGLAGSDLGVALRAVEVLLSSGLLIQETHGGHEPRVGLDGARRKEISDVVAGLPIRNAELLEWIEQG